MSDVPRLRLLPDGDPAVTDALRDAIRPLPVPDAGPAPAARVRLTPWQRMEVEAARQLVAEIAGLLDSRPHAYVAGRLEGAAANLLDILDAITEVS
jgi:hypothetical protein